MFTFVVSLVVVGGAIIAVVAIAQAGEEQPATRWTFHHRTRRVRRPRRSRAPKPRPAPAPKAPPPTRAPVVAPVAVAPATPTLTTAPERTHRLRATGELVLLIALVGVVLAVLVGAALFLLNVALRHAATSGA